MTRLKIMISIAIFGGVVAISMLSIFFNTVGYKEGKSLFYDFQQMISFKLFFWGRGGG